MIISMKNPRKMGDKLAKVSLFRHEYETKSLRSGQKTPKLSHRKAKILSVQHVNLGVYITFPFWFYLFKISWFS